MNNKKPIKPSMYLLLLLTTMLLQSLIKDGLLSEALGIATVLFIILFVYALATKEKSIEQIEPKNKIDKK